MPGEYKELKEATIALYPIINDFALNLLTTINRRLTTKASFLNPWSFQFSVPVHSSVFFQIFNCFSRYKINDHPLFVFTKKILNKKGDVKELIVLFDKRAATEFHLQQLAGSDVYAGEYFCKTIKKNFVSVEVTPDKLFSLKFNLKKNVCVVNGSFKVCNQYGCLLST